MKRHCQSIFFQFVYVNLFSLFTLYTFVYVAVVFKRVVIILVYYDFIVTQIVRHTTLLFLAFSYLLKAVLKIRKQRPKQVKKKDWKHWYNVNGCCSPGRIKPVENKISKFQKARLRNSKQEIFFCYSVPYFAQDSRAAIGTNCKRSRA